MKIFTLPDLGEGLPDAEIVRWHVQEGEMVKLDQILVSVETAKAVVEVPSPIEGSIQKLFAKAGDIVHTGAPLVEFVTSDNNHNQNTSIENNVGESNTSAHNSNTQNAELDRRNNAATAAGQLEIGTTIIKEHAPLQKQTSDKNAGSHTFNNIANGNMPNYAGNSNAAIKATPAIRAMAQQLQIDLATVTATGPNGAITKSDLEKAAASISSSSASSSFTHSSFNPTSSSSLSSEAPLEDYLPLKGVRRAMAHSMAKSHAEVVPITVMDDAKLLHWSANEDITVRIIQAIIQGIQKEPDINGWFDTKTLSRRLIKELHLGIAMDTADGLFVPVIHNADKLNRVELRTALDTLKKKVLDRSISPEDLRGATFTLSNVGVFAGRYANPVVIPPMLAILATGKIREEVVAVKGEMRICRVLPLALTFDHRVVTGGEATRFLAEMLESLEKD